MCRYVQNSWNILDILSYTICDLSTVNDAIYITKTSIPPTPLFHSLQDCKKANHISSEFPPSITLDCSHNWFSQFVLKNEIFTYISFLRLVLFPSPSFLSLGLGRETGSPWVVQRLATGSLWRATVWSNFPYGDLAVPQPTQNLYLRSEGHTSAVKDVSRNFIYIFRIVSLMWERSLS